MDVLNSNMISLDMTTQSARIQKFLTESNLLEEMGKLVSYGLLIGLGIILIWMLLGGGLWKIVGWFKNLSLF